MRTVELEQPELKVQQEQKEHKELVAKKDPMEAFLSSSSLNVRKVYLFK